MRNSTIRVVKTKALISCAVTAQLICAFVFAYAKCWFSHYMAHFSLMCLYEKTLCNCAKPFMRFSMRKPPCTVTEDICSFEIQDFQQEMIYVAKTRALISCAVIFFFFFLCISAKKKKDFSHDMVER